MVVVSFVLLQFFLQLSSGVIMGAIMQELQLNALSIGFLASAFYYVYTSLQIPVGFIFDRYNTRTILAISALICSAGCLLFALAHPFLWLITGRLLMGAGSAFAFVGLAHILRQFFPLRDFAFLIGLSETLGFLATVAGMVGMANAIHYLGWRMFIAGAALAGILISLACYRIIPIHKRSVRKPQPILPGFLAILKNPLMWINGLFVGLSFPVITVFGALWLVPFLQIKLQTNLATASTLGAMIFAGAALSCPLFGKLAILVRSRRLLMLLSCLATAILQLLILFYQMPNLWFTAAIIFLTGLCCGAYMLAFTISNELTTPSTLSTATGFTNTLAMLSAPLLQPLIGHILMLRQPHVPVYSLVDYQLALSILPLCLLAAAGLTFLLPERRH
ncbi:MAG: MFS transporter [Legionellaceae bacterium]|nr:MFS transporter [Legionellaceae bacterium]